MYRQYEIVTTQNIQTYTQSHADRLRQKKKKTISLKLKCRNWKMKKTHLTSKKPHRAKLMEK